MRIAVGLVVVLGSLAAQDPKPDEEAKDRAALQGTWDLEQLEVNGKKATADDLKKAAVKIVFADKTVVVGARKATFTLDATKSPRWLDVEDATKGKELGIYEIKGDELKICTAKTGGDRPKEFTSKATAETTLLVFKRAATKKEPDKDKDKDKKADK